MKMPRIVHRALDAIDRARGVDVAALRRELDEAYRSCDRVVAQMSALRHERDFAYSMLRGNPTLEGIRRRLRAHPGVGDVAFVENTFGLLYVYAVCGAEVDVESLSELVRDSVPVHVVPDIRVIEHKV